MWNTILVYMSKFLIDLMTQNIIITIPTVQSCHPLMNSSNTAKPRGVIAKRKALALSLNSSSRASASVRWRPGVLSPEAQMRNWITLLYSIWERERERAQNRERPLPLLNLETAISEPWAPRPLPPAVSTNPPFFLSMFLSPRIFLRYIRCICPVTLWSYMGSRRSRSADRGTRN
jgi:hypothetical protein